MKEESIEAKGHGIVAEFGGLWLKAKPTSGRKHLLDRVVAIPRRPPGFLELKKRGDTPTPEQLHEIAALRRAGFVADWTDSEAGIRRFVLKVARGKCR
jgi:hypothetical protein